eukprot:scaffold140495_cov90-Phaeocystis_antarctica.AAC.1
MDNLNDMNRAMAGSMAAAAEAPREPLEALIPPDDRLSEDQLSILNAFRNFRHGLPGRERERGAVWVEGE